MTRWPAGWLRVSLWTVVAVGIAAAIGAATVVWLGLYDVSVTSQHTAPVYRLLEQTTHQSVRHHAARAPEPPADLDQRRERGALCYRDKCLQCHGAAGIAPSDIGLSMQPLPGPLVDAASRWSARELYWIVRHGLKMSGMPAWRYRLDDADQWAVVSFLQLMPSLAPDEQRALFARVGTARCVAAPAAAAPHVGDVARGRLALHQHACTSCHVIPGVTGADVHVGPPLRGFAGRGLIAGRLANTPEELVRWIRDPKAIDPATAMPDLGVSEPDARDMAAYLATLR